MSYILSHTTLSFNFWVIIAVMILVVTAAVTVTRHVRLRKRYDSLNKEITSLYAEDAMKDSSEN